MKIAKKKKFQNKNAAFDGSSIEMFLIENDLPVQILYTSPGLHDFFSKLIKPATVSVT